MSTALAASLVEEFEITVPTAEVWRVWTPTQRECFLDEVQASLQREAELASEGNPHSHAREGIRSILRDFFDRIGKKVYLASDLPILYPGARPHCPDVIAVLDLEDRGYDDERRAWVVADEGRGVDLAIEVLHAGNRQKDLFRNVQDYAALGIPEYFVYDRAKFRLHGHRLVAGGRYAPIPAVGGALFSQVLGLDLAVVDRRLRFFYGGAQVPEMKELLVRANALLREVEARADESAQQAEAEARRLDERLEVERRRADLEAERAAQALEQAAREALRAAEEAERALEAEARAAEEAKRAAEAANRATEEAKRAGEEANRADAAEARAAELERRLAELLGRAG